MTDSNETDDQDDNSIFAAWVKDVRPLTKNQDKVLHPTPKIKARPVQPAIAEEHATCTWSDPQFSEQQLTAEQFCLQQNSGLQKRQLKKLKQGKIPIEASIDLHGYTVEQARRELQLFIHHCQAQEIRCICIVHGKGSRNEHGKAILKTAVHHWLSQAPEILALTSAQAKNGGTGALYVLLKKAF